MQEDKQIREIQDSSNIKL